MYIILIMSIVSLNLAYLNTFIFQEPASILDKLAIHKARIEIGTFY